MAGAGAGGYSYLYEPLWWTGMIAMLSSHTLYYTRSCTFFEVLDLATEPEYGKTHIMVYIGVCSLVGSPSVSVEALGIALKLTFSRMNQFKYLQTWVFIFVVIIRVLTQMNYFNKAPNTFNTAVVSPIYYVMFTSLTIVASVIMFKDWDRQNPTQIITEMCGFVTILSGTFLHKTMDTTDVVVGEIANFAAYAFAPAILVTPLGALSIIISAALAHVILKEKLHIVGVLGCALCVVGSTAIVLHAPPEQQIESVTEVWDLATERAFLFYLVIGAVSILIVYYILEYGKTHIMVYIDELPKHGTVVSDS
ncbi:hypothetical protein MLD38_001616 [Melastoma candidum]|uniref:Uncharacterized protein n=1 Tax=Melastoma candidum TaxID=119954 RepID=A0ACB9SD52_9MYRT|nr:hypothetical protein MLD38_001616 [Melastoma candidum]